MLKKHGISLVVIGQPGYLSHAAMGTLQDDLTFSTYSKVNAYSSFLKPVLLVLLLQSKSTWYPVVDGACRHP